MEEGKFLLDIVINKEKLSNGENVFVVLCPSLGIASQGDNIEEAIKNIKEAAELYLEEMPEVYEELETTRKEMPTFSIIEVKKNDKTANIIR
jgi:predicted RNase H-like HicB family nuclease